MLQRKTLAQQIAPWPCWHCAVQGTEIQATFWRESADKYAAALQDDQVRRCPGAKRMCVLCGQPAQGHRGVLFACPA
jgi:hypothetical protein